MRHTGIEISKAIKSGRWLYIVYHNKKRDTTYYWIGVKDVLIGRKRLLVDMYDPQKHLEEGITHKETTIAFERIQSAEVLEETTYETPNSLYEKLDKNIEKLRWLGYDSYDSRILSYLEECLRLDKQEYQKADEEDMVRGIDTEVLSSAGVYTLDDYQRLEVVRRIEKLKRIKRSDVYQRHHELAINDLSIRTSRGLFVVAHRRVLFNPKEGTLRAEETPTFNPNFKSGEYSHSLSHYLDMDASTFMQGYTRNPRTFADRLEENLLSNETLDERPYLMDMVRDVPLHIGNEFAAISNLK